MGEVYLAVRVDDAGLEERRQKMAVKLIKRGMDTDFVLGRFRRERQVLSRLAHPDIARLLDWGASEDGRPFFVMEYVEGTPICEYADARRLTIEGRLNLFRKVCAAVAHAHRSLVVHRDIKPSNILVTAEGAPRLLDFGIAKLLSPEEGEEAAEATAAHLRLMTPEYASPEQVTGGEITTGSDVYSLGVLLYELLTGRLPHRFKTRSPEEVAREVCGHEPERPSTALLRTEVVKSGGSEPVTLTPESVSRARGSEPGHLRRRLSGDLDMIVLKALRKEPERRYSSAEQFAEDIRRHLEGLPVVARPDTVGYRAGKFIRRHRGGVAAALLLFVVIAGGVAATAWQAAVARAERKRAERRFDDVRRLANSFMFEFDEALTRGETPARELLVRRALEYLGSLAQEAGDDPSLVLELATAYQKIGEVQGRPGSSNVGDKAGALESYRKSLTLLERLAAAEPSKAEYKRLSQENYARMSEVLVETGRAGEAVGLSRKALEVSLSLSEAAPGDVQLRRTAGLAYHTLGDLLFDMNEFGESLSFHRQGLAFREQTLPLDPSNWRLRRDVALSYNGVGRALAGAGDFAGALEHLRKGLAIDQELADAEPASLYFKRVLSSHHNHIAEVLRRAGDFAGALDHSLRSTALKEGVLASDPSNVAAQVNLVINLEQLGSLYLQSGDARRSLEYYRRGAELSGRLSATDASNQQIRFYLGSCVAGVGAALSALGDAGGGLKSLEEAAAVLTPLNSGESPLPEVRRGLAEVYARMGEVHVSLAEARRAAAADRRAHWSEARAMLGRSLDIWLALRRENRLRPSDAATVDSLTRALAQCEQKAAGA
jgi:non-specific serine/threonine protein kinase/serine/threonine-protein kinase